MKKQIALLIVLAVLFSLTACSNKTSDATEAAATSVTTTAATATTASTETNNANTSDIPDTENAPSPWENDPDTEKIIAAVGKNFGNMPADESSIAYLFMEDTQIAELSFYHAETGHYIFARMKKAEKWENIMAEMDVDFSDPIEDTAVMGHPGQIVTGEEADMPLVCGVWFDANEGIVYALAVVGEGGTLEAYADDIFHPSAAPAFSKIPSVGTETTTTAATTTAAAEETPCLWENDSDTEKIISAIGKNFGNLPADESSIAYLFNQDTQIAELSFYHLETGHYIFARMKKADEWTNIMKGMSVDFSNPTDDTAVMGHPGQIVTGEESGMPLVCGVWFDVNEGIVYALAVVGEGGSLEAYAEDMFHPSKAN